MTQDQVIILLFKIFLIAGACSIACWVAVYTHLQRWWADQIGITLVVKSLLLLGLLLISILSLFFHLSIRSSRVAGWGDLALIFLVTPVMLWRTWVWLRRSKPGQSHTPGESRNGTAARR